MALLLRKLARLIEPRYGRDCGNSGPLFKIFCMQECPMLVRLFCREGGHHPPDMFALRQNLPLEDEVIIYTWCVSWHLSWMFILKVLKFILFFVAM